MSFPVAGGGRLMASSCHRWQGGLLHMLDLKLGQKCRQPELRAANRKAHSKLIRVERGAGECAWGCRGRQELQGTSLSYELVPK